MYHDHSWKLNLRKLVELTESSFNDISAKLHISINNNIKNGYEIFNTEY